ncbi:MAG TPA: site-specific DNA-methyltransferase [Pirellulaceae bacterium]|nr:site-specific DNA-methyltransferase [Pirellulaceae bacterium]HMO91696.1 site-specific DNA-methyltransferase [Pirellulaceae bacterium]HMP68393.1 site-specific DNA-methyltransferase [Pirellulaceae bacterium]
MFVEYVLRFRHQRRDICLVRRVFVNARIGGTDSVMQVAIDSRVFQEHFLLRKNFGELFENTSRAPAKKFANRYNSKIENRKTNERVGMERIVDLAIDNYIGQVHQADCIEGLRRLPDNFAQLAFADPPFNIGYEYDEYDDRLATEDYLQWSIRWMSEVHRVLDDRGAFWLAIGDEYAAELKIEAQRIGFHTRSWVVWYYTFGVHCRTKFTRSHAHLFHFVKDPKRFVFNVHEIAVPSARQLVYADKRANPAGRTPDDTWILRPQDCIDGFTPSEDTWYFPRVAGTFKERAGFHGCQMPEQLLGRIISSCSNVGDIVLDPFAGSCTTLAVAKKKGRRFLGFELSKEYAKLGRKRIDAVCEGDELEGSPEPKVSAPATTSPKARQRAKSPVVQRGFRKSIDHGELEKAADDVIKAFAESNRGYSVDRVVADPQHNLEFQQQCDRLGLPGSAAERNRFLFRLRSTGKLKRSDVEASRLTLFDWEHLDPILFAAEIAWRSVSELYCDANLDEIFCDPLKAAQFDEFARFSTVDYSALEYRWAALKLRKQITVARKRMVGLTVHQFADSDWHPIHALNVSSLATTQALYAIRHGNQVLYAGETSDLSTRLGLQLTATAQQSWPLTEQHPGELSIAIHELPTISDARLARQCLLIDCYQPAWNFIALFSGSV